MRLEAVYWPDTNKIRQNPSYAGYYSESAVISLPVELTLSEVDEATIISSEFGVSTASPMATIFLGKGALQNMTSLARSRNISLDFEVTFNRIEQIEAERSRLTNSNQPGDVTLKIQGFVGLINKNDGFQSLPLDVKQGKRNSVSIRDIEWNDLLEQLGYPRKRNITLEDQVYAALQAYGKRHNLHVIDDMILDAIHRAETKEKTKAGNVDFG